MEHSEIAVYRIQNIVEQLQPYDQDGRPMVIAKWASDARVPLLSQGATQRFEIEELASRQISAFSDERIQNRVRLQTPTQGIPLMPFEQPVKLEQLLLNPGKLLVGVLNATYTDETRKTVRVVYPESGDPVTVLEMIMPPMTALRIAYLAGTMPGIGLTPENLSRTFAEYQQFIFRTRMLVDFQGQAASELYARLTAELPQLQVDFSRPE